MKRFSDSPNIPDAVNGCRAGADGRQRQHRVMNDTVVARTPPALAAIQADSGAPRLRHGLGAEDRRAARGAGREPSPAGGSSRSAPAPASARRGCSRAWTPRRASTPSTRDRAVVDVAQRHLGGDARVAFRLEDGAAFLARADPDTYDLVYADAWPGKFTHLDAALGCLRQGGFYVIDDLLPQPNWPEGHAAKVEALVADLERRPRLRRRCGMAWASGLMLVVRQGPTPR